MGLVLQAHAAIFILGNLVASQPLAQSLKETIKITAVNFNGEQMQITWAAKDYFPDRNVTFFYRFGTALQNGTWKQCPHYILDQGYNSGCFFKTEGLTLNISFKDKNGSEELFHHQLKSDSFIKPNPPENVTFHWKRDTVTIECNKPKTTARCLKLELQYKSKYDKEWQSRKSSCCKVEEQGFDPEKCYSFRVRLERLVPFCNRIPYASEWTEATVWRNGSLLDSCADDIKKKPLSDNVILLISVLAALLVIILLLIFVCKCQRLQKSVMPVIPDPKHIFSDLFNDHNGNFQEWIDQTDNAMGHTKMECVEHECIIEERTELEDEKEASEKLCELSNMNERDYLSSAQNTCLQPPASDTVSFGSFKFCMNEDMYVIL
ncbi:cytokine receptor-like factor 2 [Chelonia mydas]|uniref:cytokine receptor-like factor 2 n=1 Tax=Chelonia mydas TaxID=8469 RepID=UPI00042BF98F|nr:cytokine receptor-like factor 2 [Chelonia mydas]